jgi:hypothetical protein
MAWTFIDMVPADSLTTAEESAARVDDFRLAAFHDPNHLLGRAMARRLGWKAHVAWDTFFIYRPGTLWTDTEMPAPDEWFHQLKDREVWEQTAEAEFGTADECPRREVGSRPGSVPYRRRSATDADDGTQRGALILRSRFLG